jgi:uracil-DNA glycosylase family 4
MTVLNNNREVEFETLISEVLRCRKCERMDESQRVIGRASGNLNVPMMFIGEAPGRLGADASAIPFHGDRAGENFESLIEQVGIGRQHFFITNAVLCNPKDERGNNATPGKMEVQNCSGFLKRQIDLVDPAIVITLGAQALAALSLIDKHDINLAAGVRKKWDWYGRLLLPLYHPGQRAMLHRSFLNQLADYRFVAETFRKLTKTRKANSSISPSSKHAVEVVLGLLQACGPLSYFALHKLFYLLEYEYSRREGRRFSSCYIIRQKDGPYVVELNIKKLRKALPELQVRFDNDVMSLSLPDQMSLLAETQNVSLFKAPFRSVFDDVTKRYGSKSDSDLKRIVYLTSPMRKILRREKYRRDNMFNAPIDFAVENSGEKKSPSQLTSSFLARPT